MLPEMAAFGSEPIKAYVNTILKQMILKLVIEKESEGPYIFSIAEDSQGLLWFPGDKNTLYCYDHTKRKLQSYQCRYG